MSALKIVPALAKVKDRHPALRMKPETVSFEKLAFPGGKANPTPSVVVTAALPTKVFMVGGVTALLFIFGILNSP